MRMLAAALLLAVSLPSAAGDRERCTEYQIRLGVGCDSEGYRTDGPFSERDLEIARSATAQDFEFLADPEVQRGLSQLGQDLDKLNNSELELLEAERQMNDELRALERLIRENPEVFEALIREEEAAAQAELKRLQTAPSEPARPVLKPLHTTSTRPVLKPLDTTSTRPVLKPLDTTSARPVLRPLDLPPLPQGASAPEPGRLEQLRLSDKPAVGLDLSRPPARPRLPALETAQGRESARRALQRLRIDKAAIDPTKVGVHVDSEPARAYVVGKPVPVPQERTWAGWAWETAGSAWTWAFGE